MFVSVDKQATTELTIQEQTSLETRGPGYRDSH
jgi:hypothetical protein